jgi:hypothetical protein
MAEVD